MTDHPDWDSQFAETDDERSERWRRIARDRESFVTAAYRHWPDLIATIRGLRAEVAEVREILAGPDIGSLPHDWTLKQVAEARWFDWRKLRNQVRDTCRRAEKAEARVAELEAYEEYQRQERARKDEEDFDYRRDPANQPENIR